ncbi:MAG: hypothetical protein KatS3mg031_2589 [Chitinophagales bacterium]|nr:MAG: hypothetical protein KatS3mg031_2589 [Chitinophagales bacterium]
MKRLISLMIFAMFSLNCGFAQQCSRFDITGLAHGTVVNNLFQANGVTIQAIPNPGGTNKAVIYNTNGNWTEDPDLNVGIGNIIIINENPSNNDGDGTGPDDNATGGTLRFLFAQSIKVVSIIAVDVDKPGAVIKVYDAFNHVIAQIPISVGADASVQTITVNVPGTRKLEIIYRDSGGFSLNLSCPNICDAFDISGLAHGTHVDSMFMSSGITVVAIPNPGGRPDAVIYNTNGNWTEDPDLNIGIGNIIIINENPNNNDGDGTGPDDNATGGTLRFLFASPV